MTRHGSSSDIDDNWAAGNVIGDEMWEVFPAFSTTPTLTATGLPGRFRALLMWAVLWGVISWMLSKSLESAYWNLDTSGVKRIRKATGEWQRGCANFGRVQFWRR